MVGSDAKDKLTDKTKAREKKMKNDEGLFPCLSLSQSEPSNLTMGLERHAQHGKWRMQWFQPISQNRSKSRYFFYAIDVVDAHSFGTTLGLSRFTGRGITTSGLFIVKLG